jgi:dTDP-4-amino-4,6-dideoxygalactose transaminase
MDDIKMVDLYSQHFAIKEEIDQAIEQVIRSSAFINGPEVKTFQKKIAEKFNAAYAIGCGNGTDALQVALMAIGLKPGDEVITPAFSFAATIEVIALLGGKPVLCDIRDDTFNIDTSDLEYKITSKTKAIIPVHLFGQCADMGEIMRISQKHDLWVIEDAAQALSAKYKLPDGDEKYAGTIGHIGCTSFFPSKNLGCFGDGGALFTNDSELEKEIRCIINHGSSRKYFAQRIGLNSRLDTLQAAILNTKLNYLDRHLKARQKAASYYDQLLNENPHIQLPVTANNAVHTFNQYSIVTKSENRDELKDYLKKYHIPSMIYYPIPFHMQEAYYYLNYGIGDFPVSEYMANHVLSLPMHTELQKDQQEYICEKISKFFEENE